MLAVIMCSGLSRRMGQNKLLMDLGGKIIVEHVIENVISSNFDEVIMIYGDDELKRVADKYKIKAIHNPLREKGQSEAIKLGVKLADIYVRRAEMQLELGNKMKACKDLKAATALDNNVKSVFRQYCD